jgi:hypothetical protein
MSYYFPNQVVMVNFDTLVKMGSQNAQLYYSEDSSFSFDSRKLIAKGKRRIKFTAEIMNDDGTLLKSEQYSMLNVLGKLSQPIDILGNLPSLMVFTNDSIEIPINESFRFVGNNLKHSIEVPKANNYQ